jgi:hypothetical protein
VSKLRGSLVPAGVILTAASATLGIAAGPALGMHGDGFPDPDGRHLEWRVESLSSMGATACNWGANILGSRTNVDTSTGAEDVTCEDDYYNEPWLGLAQCVNVNWLGITCFDSVIRFDLSDSAQTNTFGWKYIGCHEFGHIGGLGHQPSGSSCMVDTSGNMDLGQHDIDMVNRDVP